MQKKLLKFIDGLIVPAKRKSLSEKEETPVWMKSQFMRMAELNQKVITAGMGR